MNLIGLTHEDTQQLRFALTGPGGRKTGLVSTIPGNVSGANITFSDAANALPTTLTTGTLLPNTDVGYVITGGSIAAGGSLGRFSNTDPTGTWTLHVIDVALAGNEGTLTQWSLDVDLADPVATTNASTFDAQIDAEKPLELPDDRTIRTVRVPVSAPGKIISDLDVQLRGLSHGFVGDLDMFIEAPSGTTAWLIADLDSGSDRHGVTMTVDDEAPAGTSVVHGRVRPRANVGAPTLPEGVNTPGSTLAVFDGEPAGGIWRIHIRDDTNADRGRLVAAQLQFALADAPVSVVEVEVPGPERIVELPGPERIVTVTPDRATSAACVDATSALTTARTRLRTATTARTRAAGALRRATTPVAKRRTTRVLTRATARVTAAKVSVRVATARRDGACAP